MDNSSVFKRFGMTDLNIKRMLKNEAKCKIVRAVIEDSGLPLDNEAPSDISKLIIELGVHKKAKSIPCRKKFLEYVVARKITKKTQLVEGIKYLAALKDENAFNEKDFETATGVGLDVSEDVVKKLLDEYFKNTSKEKILENPNAGKLSLELKTIHPKLKFADGKFLYSEVETQLVGKLGLKNAKELRELGKRNAKKSKGLISSMKFKVRDLAISHNTKEMIEKQNVKTKGKIFTRFPPEPNGHLHIGHCRAMTFSFEFATEKEGSCYLRFDDTNPEKENMTFVNGIKDIVKWMGFKPAFTTYSSTYFEQLYEYAEILIKKDLAYVDFSSKSEIEDQRKNMKDSPYRCKFTREENLQLFRDMRDGKYKEKECCLRCKIDSKSLNPNLRDFVAYRIKYVPHPHVGSKWCIYPSYDFSHCIIDSIENITHSLCSLEFETRRDSYYWLLHALEIYKPFVWEFSRLNVSTALLSKRWINKLIEMKVVKGFDDPRLLTVAGLRRRGYTPDIIKSFCLGLGASRTSKSIVSIKKLESVCREFLDKDCTRIFCILKPLKVIIINMENQVKFYEAPNHPKNKKMGKRKMPFSKTLYIERDDFREVDDVNYFGLAPNKEVGLRYGPNIKCVKVIKNKQNKIVEIHCEVDYEKKNKTKGHIHWLSSESPKKTPLEAEVRIYDYLLKVDEFSEKKMKLLDVINMDSEHIHKGCLIERILEKKKKRKKRTSYQFERVGFFTIDDDTTKKDLIFNMIIPLRESKEK